LSEEKVEKKIPEKTTEEEDKVTAELREIFIDLLGSAQKLSYELATLEIKDKYEREELKDLFDAAKQVVSNVKKMHKFLERHGRRR
jgi:prophage maintenance system killer protein